jgi:hypothetical protein
MQCNKAGYSALPDFLQENFFFKVATLSGLLCSYLFQRIDGIIAIVTVCVYHEKAVVAMASNFYRGGKSVINLWGVFESELLSYVCPKAGVTGSLPTLGILNHSQNIKLALFFRQFFNRLVLNM